MTSRHTLIRTEKTSLARTLTESIVYSFSTKKQRESMSETEYSVIASIGITLLLATITMSLGFAGVMFAKLALTYSGMDATTLNTIQLAGMITLVYTGFFILALGSLSTLTILCLSKMKMMRKKIA
jgi:hypothetical protein